MTGNPSAGRYGRRVRGWGGAEEGAGEGEGVEIEARGDLSNEAVGVGDCDCTSGRRGDDVECGKQAERQLCPRVIPPRVRVFPPD